MKTHELSTGIRTARESLEWSVRDLAERSGLSTGTISSAENGGNLRLSTAHAIAGGFGMSLQDLIHLDEDLRNMKDEQAKIESEMRLLALGMLNGKIRSGSESKKPAQKKRTGTSRKNA